MYNLAYIIIIGLIAFNGNNNTLNTMSEHELTINQKIGLEIGDIAPELAFNDPSGKKTFFIFFKRESCFN